MFSGAVVRLALKSSDFLALHPGMPISWWWYWESNLFLSGDGMHGCEQWRDAFSLSLSFLFIYAYVRR